MKTTRFSLAILTLSLVTSGVASTYAANSRHKAPSKTAAKSPAKKTETPAKAATPVQPDESNFTIDPAVSTVVLRMSHSITGRFETSGKNALNGKIEVTPSGKIIAKRLEFKPNSFESLISLRDEHIKNMYLETAKYPIVALENVVTELARFESALQGEPAKNEEKGGRPHDKPFTAELIVKGTRVPVRGTANVYLENDVLKGHVEFDAKISSFPIKTPKYMGVGVLDEFTILVDFYARPDIADDEAVGAGDI